MKTRQRIPELMDDPALDPRIHHRALRGLGRLNRWSGAVSAAWTPIEQLARRAQPLSVLDIATGGADIPIGLWRRGQQRGVELSLAACDASAGALAFARDNCSQAGAPVKLFRYDALKDSIDDVYDVVMCTTFAHHLADDQVATLLRRMHDSARLRVVVVDLVRSWTNWLQVLLATRALTRSRIVHVDGPRSVRAAFTIKEMHGLAERAGLPRCRIYNKWPCRFVLVGDC